jgi:hypothetical protein
VLPASTPPGVVQLIRQCLEKDRNLRLRDIGDARADLEPAPAEPGAIDAAAGTSRRDLKRARWLSARQGGNSSKSRRVAAFPRDWERPRSAGATRRPLDTLDVQSGRTLKTTSLNLPPTAALAGFSLNPDGKRFATAMGVPRHDIWPLTGFEPGS